jgi:hypothetical protein
MTEDKKENLQEGYQPKKEIIKKGYQPENAQDSSTYTPPASGTAASPPKDEKKK